MSLVAMKGVSQYTTTGSATVHKKIGVNQAERISGKVKKESVKRKRYSVADHDRRQESRRVLRK